MLLLSIGLPWCPPTIEPMSFSFLNLSLNTLSITSPASPCGVFSGDESKSGESMPINPTLTSFSINSLSKSLEFAKPFFS